MTDQHRATDSEWYCIKARTCGDKSDMVAYSTILELLHRIEALEAARRPPPQTLTSIALQTLDTIERDAHYLPEITDTIRRALEALPDD